MSPKAEFQPQRTFQDPKARCPPTALMKHIVVYTFNSRPDFQLPALVPRKRKPAR
jgi:hypothetical protein